METEDFDVVIDLGQDEDDMVQEFADEQGLYEELRSWFSLAEGQTCADLREEDCYFQMLDYDLIYPDEPYRNTTLWWMQPSHPVAMALYCISHEDPEYEVGDSSIGIAVVYKDVSVKRGVAELLSFFKRNASEKCKE